MAKKQIKKPKKKKNKGGRPSKFPEIVKFLPGITQALEMGHSEKVVCKMYNISLPTLEKYKEEDKEFFCKIRDAKQKANFQVHSGIFKRAVGYTYEEKTYENGKLKKRVVKELPPDGGMLTLYAKNHMNDIYKDRQELDISNSDGSLSPDKITINLIPTMPKNATKQD